MNHIEELAKLAELRDKGILTDEEFQAEKAKLLNGKDAVKSEDSVGQNREAKPSIVIQSSSSAGAASAAASKSGGGFLKAIGALAVVAVGVGLCTSVVGNDKKKQAETVAAADEQARVEAEQQSAANADVERQVEEARQNIKAWAEDKEIEFNQADARLTKVWGDLDKDVRDRLKKEQIAWNRSKESTCNQNAKDEGTTDDEIRGAKFECLTEWTNRRVPELVEKEKELAQRVANAKNAALEKEADAEMAALMGDFKALPQEVAQTFNGGNGLESWFDETEKRCTREEKSHVDSDKAAAAGWQCVIDAVKAKREELKGYQI